MKYKKYQTTLILGLEGACCADFCDFFLSSTLSWIVTSLLWSFLKLRATCFKLLLGSTFLYSSVSFVYFKSNISDCLDSHDV